ncbi:cofactor-independent phosphoglycerate mutase [Geopsychrobacter electrodiphilus]|uniref:cofactor-independent phosphoglycerate mutase n=1 Tax=Geopsychrobacter electrodiphilus TaxID=225196 RepID=UPI00035ECD43|nr:cofactor-independent phosphoglycerate mutase [Geopsychrobacter electrodiphilus]
MKYLVLLGDGMADEPIEVLGGLTPLQKAHTPHMDILANSGILGMAATVPKGFHPGSDVANLAVFGYDPALSYSGRAPLEAASIGVDLGPDDIAFRLNLVWLEAHYGKLYMGDFSAGHICTSDAAELINSLQSELGDDQFSFHPGISYRHLLVWHGGREKLTCTPPHDISSQSIESHLPQGEGSAELIALTTSAQMLLANHPVNNARLERGDLPANSIWLWGQGRRPQMKTFQELYGLDGGVISAVDLIRGLGVCAGLKIVEVPGATGYIDTNYLGKGEAALELLKESDFVYLHVEAPDEAAHGGLLDEKIQAIEDFDRFVVGTIYAHLDQIGDCRILVMPDHPTPVELRTHTAKAVPYLLFDSRTPHIQRDSGYSEVSAESTGVRCAGHLLLPQLLEL